MGNVGLPLANDSLFRLRCPTALPVPGVTRGRYIPSELGYGDSGSPPKIKGGDPLVFQMEIIKIKVRGRGGHGLRVRGSRGWGAFACCASRFLLWKRKRKSR